MRTVIRLFLRNDRGLESEKTLFRGNFPLFYDLDHCSHRIPKSV